MNPAQVKEWLQYAPADPGPCAAGLAGFSMGSFFYCTRCTGRLLGRAILLPRDALPVWSDQLNGSMKCDACGSVQAIN